MKKYLAAFISLISSYTFAQVTNIGPYTIGKTTLNDFYRLSGSEAGKADIISTEIEYESIWSKLYFDTVYHDTRIYSMKFDKKNIEDYGWKLNSATNQRTQIFYITQLQQPDFVANNILLTFYKDALTGIEYDLPAGLFNSFVNSYQKGGDSSTETKTASQCKTSHSPNISKTISIYNPDSHSHTVFDYIEGLDAACKAYSHFSIKIMNQDLWQQYINDARSSLPSTQQKLSEKQLNDLLKKLQKEQKKKSRSGN